MKTKLTSLLGIQYPIIQGAMAWISDAKLAAAVANAGGTGVIACGGRDAARVRQEIQKARELTTKPFGVNVTLQAANKDEMFAMLYEEKVSFVSIGAGNPVPYIKPLQQVGTKVIPVVPSLKLAKRVEESGADALIVEGMEAGGHVGTQTTMALMTNVLSAIKIPVVVAGGIADGRGMAAALLMGAAGVQMGSRFLLTHECALHANAKQRIIEAVDTDSVITGYARAHSIRGIKNAFTEKFFALERSGAPQEELDKLATGTNRLSAVEGDIDNGFVQVGQSLNVLNKIQSVQEVVDEVLAEVRQILLGAADLAKLI